MRCAIAVLGLTLPLCAVAQARVPPIDLRPIQHRFVELQLGAERLHIQSRAQWQAFWGRFSDSTAPDIDFRRHDVLVVLMGTQGSGGYSIGIRRIDAGKDGTSVRLLLCRPPRGSAQVAELTSPYDVRLTPKLAAPIAWRPVAGTTGTPPCT